MLFAVGSTCFDALLRQRRRGRHRWHHLLRRVPVLHHGRSPAIPGGCECAAPHPAPASPSAGASSPGSRTASTGGPPSCSSPGRCCSASARSTRCSDTCRPRRPTGVDPRRLRVHLLPGCERARVGRGQPRPVVVAPRSLSWLITALNLLGSIAFGASAVASYVVPASDQPRNVTLMNLGTFVGALAFLVGAGAPPAGAHARRRRLRRGARVLIPPPRAANVSTAALDMTISAPDLHRSPPITLRRIGNGCPGCWWGRRTSRSCWGPRRHRRGSTAGLGPPDHRRRGRASIARRRPGGAMDLAAGFDAGRPHGRRRRRRLAAPRCRWVALVMFVVLAARPPFEWLARRSSRPAPERRTARTGDGLLLPGRTRARRGGDLGLRARHRWSLRDPPLAVGSADGAAWSVIVLVAWCRVWLGVHWTSDVVGSLASCSWP